MKVILCKPNEQPKAVDIKEDHDYRDIKRLLEIESPLTCVERKIGNAYYDLWCDDEGLFPDKKYASAMLMHHEGQEILCGNVLIAKHDGEGNTIGLKKEELEEILNDSNWVNNRVLMKYRFSHGGCMLDENGDMVIASDYIGFGEVCLHKGGTLLKYSI